MLTKLDHQRPEEQEKLIKIGADIATLTGAESVICYGCRTSTMQQWSPFLVGNRIVWEHPTYNYDLLLILPDGKKYKDSDLADQINQRLGHGQIFSIISVRSGEMRRLLQEGNLFMCSLYHGGLSLYHPQEEGIPIPMPVKPFPKVHDKIRHACLDGFNKACDLYERAAKALQSGNHNDAMVSLHDSAEKSFIALLLAFTGYESQGKDLRTLKVMCSNFLHPYFSPLDSYPVAFNLLADARRHGMASSHLSVSEQQLNDLKLFVWIFQEMAVAFYHNHTGIKTV